MNYRDRVNEDYFEWLCKLVDMKRWSEDLTYRRLLRHLHNIEFTWTIRLDENRADDGIQLRRRYALRHDDMSLQEYLSGPCSVLEMMAALALRCEDWIMDDDQIGNRTGQWFWGMIHNLGLTPMIDKDFNRDVVDNIVARFLNREYAPDGRGGLFTVRNCIRDVRKVEIWTQLSWYLGSIT